jgi:hypothetical protein
MIDRNSIDDYLKMVNFNSIDEKNFTITDFIKTDKINSMILKTEKLNPWIEADIHGIGIITKES